LFTVVLPQWHGLLPDSKLHGGQAPL